MKLNRNYPFISLIFLAVVRQGCAGIGNHDIKQGNEAFTLTVNKLNRKPIKNINYALAFNS